MKDARFDLTGLDAFPPASAGTRHPLEVGDRRPHVERRKVVLVDAAGQVVRSDKVAAGLAARASLRRFGKTSVFRVGETVVVVKKGHVSNREKRALARRALMRRLRDKAAAADAGRSIDTTGLSDEAFIALLRR